MGGDFQQYRANVSCGRAECTYISTISEYIFQLYIQYVHYKLASHIIHIIFPLPPATTSMHIIIIAVFSFNRTQVPARTRRRTSTVSSASSCAPTPTKWWLTGASTRSSTQSWPRASRSSLRRRRVASPAVACTPASRHTTTA